MRDRPFTALLLMLSLHACANASSESPLAALTPSHLQTVSQARVFFGHQSVGQNILEGVQTLNLQHGAPLAISEGRTGSEKAGLLHSPVGQNEQPLSKIADFESVMQTSSKPIDVAFFKFCYIDFRADTDVTALFNAYQKTLAALKAKHPTTTFAHVTVPLTTLQTGPKAWIKSWLGKGAWGEKENVKRHEFNELLRAEYARREPVFDLARHESTDPNGKPETFRHDGRRIPSLVPEYSHDGQHLNSGGQVRIARELLAFLSGVVAARQSPPVTNHPP